MDAVSNAGMKASSIHAVQSVQDAQDALSRASDDEREMFRALFADPRSEILLWGESGIAILLVEEESARCVVLKGVEEAADLPTLLQRWEEVRGVTANWDRTMRIAPLLVEDVPLTFPLGLAYYREIPVPGSFLPSYFRESWQKFYAAGSGLIVGLWCGDFLVGVFGGLVFPHPNDGRLLAQHLFWYVYPDHRGTALSFQLVEAFEAWAAERGACDFRVGYLTADPLAAKLDRWMDRAGFAPFEVTRSRPIRRHDA